MGGTSLKEFVLSSDVPIFSSASARSMSRLVRHSCWVALDLGDFTFLGFRARKWVSSQKTTAQDRV
jgi:hypothetical protein